MVQEKRRRRRGPAEPPLSTEDVERIQQSFALAAPIAEAAADLFYDRLFTIAPEVRPLFKNDIKDQGRKLMAMLGAVVGGLSDLPSVIAVAEDLARRHVDYGVKPEHYAPVGAALLWTLERGLGEDFTPEVRASWAKAYGALSDVMIKGAYPARAA